MDRTSLDGVLLALEPQPFTCPQAEELGAVSDACPSYFAPGGMSERGLGEQTEYAIAPAHIAISSSRYLKLFIPLPLCVGEVTLPVVAESTSSLADLSEVVLLQRHHLRNRSQP